MNEKCFQGTYRPKRVVLSPVCTDKAVFQVLGYVGAQHGAIVKHLDNIISIKPS